MAKKDDTKTKPKDELTDDTKTKTKEEENEFLKKMAGINKDVPNVNDNPKLKVLPVSNVVTNQTSIDVPSDLNSIADETFAEQVKYVPKSELRGNYTLVVEHTIMERLNELEEHFYRGFKSDLVNKALDAFISNYESKPLPPKKKKKGRR